VRVCDLVGDLLLRCSISTRRVIAAACRGHAGKRLDCLMEIDFQAAANRPIGLPLSPRLGYSVNY